MKTMPLVGIQFKCDKTSDKHCSPGGGGGGDLPYKVTGMIVGNFEKNP